MANLGPTNGAAAATNEDQKADAEKPKKPVPATATGGHGGGHGGHGSPDEEVSSILLACLHFFAIRLCRLSCHFAKMHFVAHF